MNSTNSKIIENYMREARPQINPKVWVLVNHNNKTIQFFLNEGQSFNESNDSNINLHSKLNGNGSYMSLDYFTHHYKKDMMLQDYSYLNYPSTI